MSDEVNVIFVGISGSGFVGVDGGLRLLSCGTLTKEPGVPPGAPRRTSPTLQFIASVARTARQQEGK